MRNLCVLVVLLVGLVCLEARTDAEVDLMFVDWMVKYNKTYTSNTIYRDRLRAFKKNVDFVDSWTGSFQVGLNMWADLTIEEFSAMAPPMPYAPEVDLLPELPEERFQNGNLGAPPASVDWRDPSPIVQVTPLFTVTAACQCLWCYSVIGAVEAAQMRVTQTDQYQSMSAQMALDCGRSSQSCSTGSTYYGFIDLLNRGGCDNSNQYPWTYNGKNTTCNQVNPVATVIANLTYSTSGSETTLKQMVGNVGPASIWLDTNHPSFQLYSGGVYEEAACKSGTQYLNRPFVVVGYGQDWSSPYNNFWLIKNVWGIAWGENGYMRLRRDFNNMCGIATYVFQPYDTAWQFTESTTPPAPTPTPHSEL